MLMYAPPDTQPVHIYTTPFVVISFFQSIDRIHEIFMIYQLLWNRGSFCIVLKNVTETHSCVFLLRGTRDLFVFWCLD